MENNIQQICDIEQMRKYVGNALDMKLMGNALHYNTIVRHLKEESLDPAALCRLYVSLAQSVSVLSKHPKLYQQLLHEIFRFDWGKGNETVVDAFVGFICHLVSSNGTFVLPSIKMLVKELVPKKNDTVVNEKVLGALQTLIVLVPTACKAIFPVLAEHFPHKIHHVSIQTGYLSNLLKVIQSIPSIQDRVIALILDKLVEIDVEIKLEEKEIATDEMADKLDHMMKIMFQFLEQECTENKDQAANVFQQVLRVFDRSILHTHRSKFPQFLVFYLCHFSSDFQQIFVSQLLYIALAQNAPSSTRYNCLMYLSSFVARAKFVSIDQVQSTIVQLMKWLHDHCHEAQNAMTSSIFQSVCYILCFRGYELIDVLGVMCLQNLGWQRVIESPCQPFEQFMEEIATEFQAFALRFNLMKEFKPSDSTAHPSRTFFPFDPYLLRSSNEYIEPLYLHWKSRQDDEEQHQVEPSIGSLTDSEDDDQEDGF